MPTISRTGLKWRLHGDNNPPPPRTQDTRSCNAHTPCKLTVMIRFKSCPSLLLFPAVDIVVCGFKSGAIVPLCHKLQKPSNDAAFERLKHWLFFPEITACAGSPFSL